ncbi:MAG: glycosyltransferase family 2 protein [Cyanobacteria bacterium CAN_BIN43]|nr:glycosyltransferase family 2 protein [Cyanobacteria bacterium CAN_BIN43]
MPVSQFTFFLIYSALSAIALLLAIPVVALLLECMAAVFSSPKTTDRAAFPISKPAPRVAVLMPAHDEAGGIRLVLEGLLPQLAPQDRLVVIADNCSDDTAAIAKEVGATVIERHDSQRKGKGYALDYGMNFLESDPPDVVVLIDADCRVEEGTVAQIAQQAIVTHQPVQAVYVMDRPTRPTPKDSVSALAFLVKNQVRPSGLRKLGFPCLLTGTGMAFPWSVLRGAKLASSNIVEDMQLAVDLVIAGHPTSFCANARVNGILPQQERAAKSQRTRWEQGHLKTALTQIPRLLQAAIQQRRFALVAIALDLCIPPLSLLVTLWAAALTVTLIAGAFGISTASLIALLGLEGGLILISVLSAWAKFGRELPLLSLLAVPFYILWKIPLYFNFIVNPQTKWVRTERDIDGAKL